MRKLMFSLVATLAFGSFAMANNVDVETVEAVSVDYDCVAEWETNLDFYLIVEECDWESSLAAADADFENCLDEMY